MSVTLNEGYWRAAIGELLIEAAVSYTEIFHEILKSHHLLKSNFFGLFLMLSF